MAPKQNGGERMRETASELCSFEGRIAGSDAERRAANRFAERLRGIGREATVEPTHVHPQFALIQAAHCALAFAGSLLATVVPAAGFAIVLVTATSLYLDLNTRFYLLRRLFFRRASQNVVSPGSNPDAPARLLICAHLDAARSGVLFDERNRKRLAALNRLLPGAAGPFRLIFWSAAILLPLIGLRMAGVESNVVAILQLPPTLVLLVAVFALVDIELSPIVAGANDNASGVATALALADELTTDPPAHLDVWILLTGGAECQMEGMRSFTRSHRKALDRSSTFVLVIDSVGNGELRYVTSQGLAVGFPMDAKLVAMAHTVAEARGTADQPAATALRHGFADDALATAAARLRSISLTALEPGEATPSRFHSVEDRPQHLDPRSLERARDFALDLIGLLGRDVARRAQGPAAGASRLA